MSSSQSQGCLEKISMLRAFVSDSRWTDSDLTRCLRKCGYNVERAAEMIITRKYKREETLSAASVGGKKPAPLKPPPPSARPKPPPSTAGSSSVKPSTQPSNKPTRQLPRVSISPQTDHVIDYSASFEEILEPKPPVSGWILCQRWISDAICTARSSRTRYNEPLFISAVGRGALLFRGKRIEGKLPQKLALSLAPLVHSELVMVYSHALMDSHSVPMGAHVPISITVCVPDPKRFLDIFQCDHVVGAAAHRNMTRDVPLATAAFELLQWAEYGDFPDFTATNDESVESKGEEEDDDEADSDETVNEEGNELDEALRGDGKLLEEAPCPEDMAEKGIQLRPYQGEALHWMMDRESRGEKREELEEQLKLLAELSEPAAMSGDRVMTGQNLRGSQDILCECGPVLVSERARRNSKTIGGLVNPIDHPMWRRRFLASPDLKETLSFYVNEFSCLAADSPPEPPKPCSGGILADSMGLGKTVMLMALVSKSKELRVANKQGGPKTTLVVAKLSLLAQWEEELVSKTSLSYLVLYGGKNVTFEELNGVDVVLTTYGTLPELRKKDSVVFSYDWLRVILDEAHSIRNPLTVSSKACCSLIASHRWCVSGTIIQNGLHDVFGIVKFLRHEPWCLPSFWNAVVTKPMVAASDANDGDSEAAKTLAMDRVRRMLAPTMLRRTKDTVSKDGKPILTLPPKEIKTVTVTLSPAEREFYEALMNRSRSIFEGYVETGMANKSYFQIFSLLQRLRQMCDHVGLTVRNRFSTDRPESIEVDPSVEPKEDEAGSGVGKRFLEGLMSKLFSKGSTKKRVCSRQDDSDASPRKKAKAEPCYLSQVANMLASIVDENLSHLNEECAICLEPPKVEEAAMTPCAHIFCRECLVGVLRSDLSSTSNRKSPSQQLCGNCPTCNAKVEGEDIIVFERDHEDRKSVTTSYLFQEHSDIGSQNKVKESAARQILEKSASGVESSSKLDAVLEELNNVWKIDPHSKILIYSHYLGFLDLLQVALGRNNIPCFRLDGSLSLKARMKVLEEFRSTKVAAGNFKPTATDENIETGSVLLLSMSAGAEGLNLVSASSCFIVEPWWNAAREDQCVNRIHRIGQKADIVRVRKFVTEGTVEERILDLQRRKQKVVDAVIDKTEGGLGSTTTGRLDVDDLRTIFQH